jgi:hypothetical protein
MQQQQQRLIGQLPSDDEEDRIFWLSNNVPSSKNNKVWTGEFFVNSEAVQKWRRKAKYEIHAQAIWFQYMLSMLPQPYFIEFTFIRNTKHKFDYINALQVILDDVVGYGKVEKKYRFDEKYPKRSIYLGWLTDDNTTIIRPYFREPIYDKENAGVIIKILREEPIHDLQNNTIPDYRILKQQLDQSIILGRTFKQRNPEPVRQTRVAKKTGRRADN